MIRTVDVGRQFRQSITLTKSRVDPLVGSDYRNDDDMDAAGTQFLYGRRELTSVSGDGIFHISLPFLWQSN